VYAQQDHEGGEPRIYCLRRVVLRRHFSKTNQMSDVSSNISFDTSSDPSSDHEWGLVKNEVSSVKWA
jgi:hypothetical protein